jgi:hypothetical protein
MNTRMGAEYSIVCGPRVRLRIEIIATLSDHAPGNVRALMNVAGKLPVVAAQRKIPQLEEKLFLEAFAVPSPVQIKAATRR